VLKVFVDKTRQALCV